MDYTLDGIIDFAGLTVESIEKKLGFEIDYENLSAEFDEE